ncbi:MAG: dTDP-glucose 4,6-dehydratase [Chlamydiota bacterium]
MSRAKFLIHPLSNLLVTGGSGFMGSAFIRYLFEKTPFAGKLVNLDLLTYASSQDNLLSVQNSPCYHFFQGNINQTDLVEDLLLSYEIDLIVNFAAETHVDRSICDPAPFMDTNVRGVFSLLELIRRYTYIHFHQISTDEVFGSLGEEGSFYEHSPYRPNSPYSASKASADHLVRAYSRTYGLSTTVSHAVNNFGPYQHPEKLIPKMMGRLRDNKPVPIYGKGAQKRSWIFVEEHARALWILLNRGVSGETYNIPGTATLSNLEVVQAFTSLLQEQGLYQGSWEEAVLFTQERLGHDFRYHLDGKKLFQLGYAPEVSFSEGLLKTYRWEGSRQRS